MREFGKVYDGKGDVYIKVRVELLSEYGNHTTFVMSFHYAAIRARYGISQSDLCLLLGWGGKTITRYESH